MQLIDEPRLESDVVYRYGYLSEFMGFDNDDIEMIHAAAPLLAPLVPTLVDAVYDKLSGYDATWRHFVPRQRGYEGPLPTNVDELNVSDEVIQYRKKHLASYLTALVTQPYGEKLVHYLDAVGAMHTPNTGSDRIDVPLVQMNALLGFVADAFNATIFALDIDEETRQKVIRAFSKLLWIQNDLINRHYVPSNGAVAAAEAALAAELGTNG